MWTYLNSPTLRKNAATNRSVRLSVVVREPWRWSIQVWPVLSPGPPALQPLHVSSVVPSTSPHTYCLIYWQLNSSVPYTECFFCLQTSWRYRSMKNELSGDLVVSLRWRIFQHNAVMLSGVGWSRLLVLHKNRAVTQRFVWFSGGEKPPKLANACKCTAVWVINRLDKWFRLIQVVKRRRPLVLSGRREIPVISAWTGRPADRQSGTYAPRLRQSTARSPIISRCNIIVMSVWILPQSQMDDLSAYISLCSIYLRPLCHLTVPCMCLATFVEMAYFRLFFSGPPSSPFHVHWSYRKEYSLIGLVASIFVTHHARMNVIGGTRNTEGRRG